MKTLKRLLLFFVFLLGISVSMSAQLDAKVAIFYLKNLPQERIGSETDEKIIGDLEAQGYKVISVDCSIYPQTSPELEDALTKFHRDESPNILKQYFASNEVANLDVFYVPEGYTLKKHIPVWNIKTDGAEGSLDRIMDTYNNEIVSKTKYGRTPVSSPDEMIDKKGNPLDYNLYMHVIYPSGTASHKVPLVVNFASSSQMQKGFNPVKPKESTIYRNIFPVGFVTTGYAWAHVDHPYNPLARDHVYEYFERYSLEYWNGLNAGRAYIRYLRKHAEELNLNGKIGAMGISKASYNVLRLTNLDNANQEEKNLFNDTPNTKPQPWEGVESTIDVAWFASGTAVYHVSTYAEKGLTVPVATSAGLTDQYGHWNLYPDVVKYFTKNNMNHLALWMEDLGHDYPCIGTDLSTGESRYVLLKKFFDSYLKPATALDPLDVLYIYPKEHAEDVTNKGYSKLYTSDDLLPSMQGLPITAPITVRFLSEVDIQEIASKVKVVHKQTQTALDGVWTESIPNMAFEFEPHSDLIKNNDYEIVLSEGLKNKKGQVLADEIRREFTVQTIIVVPEEEKYRVFFDDFERSKVGIGGIPETKYTVTNNKIDGPAPDVSISGLTAATPNGRLRLWNNQKTNTGRSSVMGELADYSSSFASKINAIEGDSISWSFNLRHTTDMYFTNALSGFGDRQNGIATILLATDSDIETASGYAVVVGDATHGKRYRLVKFTNGLNDNSKLENIASSENAMVGIGSVGYHALKVVYIPENNTWKLYCKTQETEDMSATAIPLVATGVDDTFVETEMKNFGFLSNYHTTSNADRMVFWDNYSVRVFDSKSVLNDLKVNQETIEFFDKEKYTYTYYLPYTHSVEDVPEITAVKSNGEQKIKIVSATNLSGSLEERTSVVYVSTDKETVEYKVTFEILPELDIFLCLGQSNMNGYGEILDEDKGLIDNTFLLTPQKRFEGAENPLNKYTTMANNSSNISPSSGFAQGLQGKTTNPIGLLVNARNGSSIKDWEKGNENTGLYDNTLARAEEAKKWGTIKGIIWHQGESDSWQYDKYPDLLSSWVNTFRADIGDANNEILFVAGELAYWRSSGTSQPFNELLHQIEDYIPNSDWVSAENLTPWKDETDPHFSRESAIELGNRYAEKVIERLYTKKILAPVITSQPESLNVVKGTSVRFAIEAEGEDLLYQWYKNDSAIAGAIQSVFSLEGESVNLLSAGEYSCQVSNASGSVMSEKAVLVVAESYLVEYQFGGVSSSESHYLVPQTETSSSLEVKLVTATNDIKVYTDQGELLENNTLHVDISKPMNKEYTFTLKTTNNLSADYTVRIEKYFNFDDLVVERWNNTLLVNNNASSNGNWTFSDFKWFKGMTTTANFEVIGTGQYYSAGNKKTDLLDTSAYYYVEVKTKSGEVLRTWPSKVEVKTSQVKIYPTVLDAGELITVDAEIADADLKNAVVNIYNLGGSSVTNKRIHEKRSQIQSPSSSGVYILHFKANNVKESVKLNVK